MTFVIKVALVALTLLVLTRYVPGLIVADLLSAIVAAIVLGVLNVLVRPVVVLLTLPLSVITFGLFLLVINATFFALAATIVPGVSVDGFWPAFVGALGVSVAGLIANRLS